MMSRNGGRTRTSRPAAAARSDSSRISSAVGQGQRHDQGGGVEPVRHVVDVLAGAAHPHTIDTQASLGLVVVQKCDREEPARLVVHHAAQQPASGIAGAEHDDAPFVASGHSVPTAPAADQEAHGEHAQQGQGPSDHRDAAGDHQGSAAHAQTTNPAVTTTVRPISVVSSKEPRRWPTAYGPMTAPTSRWAAAAATANRMALPKSMGANLKSNRSQVAP